MMNKKNGDYQFFRELFENFNLVIVACVTDLAPCVTNHLERINDNQSRTRMVSNKTFYLFFKPFTDFEAECCKENIGSLVGNGQQSFLQPACGIFKTDIERCSFRSRKVPYCFALRNTNAPVKHQPRLADFRCAADNSKSLRQQLFNHKFCRRQVHIKKRVSVNGVECFSDV